MIGVMEKVMCLVVYILKIIFYSFDLSIVFDLKCLIGNINFSELFGLVEKMKNIEVCVNSVEEKENVSDLDVYWLVFNVDIYIGVEVIGNFKGIIKSMMCGEGDVDDMKVCLYLLILFVRIIIICYFFLFRILISIIVKGGESMREILLNYIKNEWFGSE